MQDYILQPEGPYDPSTAEFIHGAFSNTAIGGTIYYADKYKNPEKPVESEGIGPALWPVYGWAAGVKAAGAKTVEDLGGFIVGELIKSVGGSVVNWIIDHVVKIEPAEDQPPPPPPVDAGVPSGGVPNDPNPPFPPDDPKQPGGYSGGGLTITHIF